MKPIGKERKTQSEKKKKEKEKEVDLAASMWGAKVLFMWYISTVNKRDGNVVNL